MRGLGSVRRPAFAISPGVSVREAAETMARAGVSAAVVMIGRRLVGILSEQDIARRVVAQGLDPEATVTADVMSAPVRTVREALPTSAALDIMHGGGFRHLPVVDGAGNVLGMVSVRDLLRQRLGELDLQNTELLGFLAADAPGG